MWWSDGCWILLLILHPGPWLWSVGLAYLVLVARPMKMTHQGLLPWMAGSSSGCGTRWPQMWLRDSRSTSCTPGPTCSASFTNGWWQFPHSALPFHTMDSGLPYWNDRGCPDGGYWLGPWPFGTLRGTLGGRTSTLLAGFLEHSWCTAVCSIWSKSPWSCRFQSLVDWWIQSYSGKCQPCHKKSCCQSTHSFLSSTPLSPSAPIWNPCWRLPGNSLTRLYGGAFPPSTLNGGLPRSCFGGGLRWGWRLHPVRQVVSLFGLRWGPRCHWCRWRRSLQGRFLLRGDTPVGMLSRVDIGAFPSSRWKGVTIIPQASGGLALRAVLQVARKVGHSFFSSSIASASRHWMSLACDCWIEWASKAHHDSTSLIAVEHQFSASAEAWTQLASASLIQVACQIVALLISTTQWASASLIVWAQGAFSSLMALVISDSLLQRAIPKSETCFLWWVSIEDLVTNKYPQTLLASSWSCVTSKEEVSLLGPEVLAGGEGEAWVSSRVGSSMSASSGMLNWEEVSTGLADSSSLRGSGVAKARDSGLFGVELPDARPEVSRTAWDRSLLTSMVMLIWPSTFGGRALEGLVARVGLKPLPRERAFDSGSFVADWERSTCKKVYSPLSIDTPLDRDSGRVITTNLTPIESFWVNHLGAWPQKLVNLQLADLSIRDIAGISLHHNTQVTLCREGHVAGISIELHQGIGPVRPSEGQLGELLGCIAIMETLAW